MPIYEYKCGGCGEVFEVLQRYDDPPPEKHETCGSTEITRVMSATSFVLKGSGWYATDYARKDSGKTESGAKAQKTEASTKTSPKAATSPVT